MITIKQPLLYSLTLLCLAACVPESRKDIEPPEENKEEQQQQQPWRDSGNTLRRTQDTDPTKTQDTDLTRTQDTNPTRTQDTGTSIDEDKEIAVHAAFLRSEEGAMQVVMALLAAAEEDTLAADVKLKVLKARLINFYVTPDKVEKLSEDGTAFNTSLELTAKVSVGEKFYCVKGKLTKAENAILTADLSDGVSAEPVKDNLKSLTTTTTIETDGCGL